MTAENLNTFQYVLPGIDGLEWYPPSEEQQDRPIIFTPFTLARIVRELPRIESHEQPDFFSTSPDQLVNRTASSILRDLSLAAMLFHNSLPVGESAVSGSEQPVQMYKQNLMIELGGLKPGGKHNSRRIFWDILSSDQISHELKTGWSQGTAKARHDAKRNCYDLFAERLIARHVMNDFSAESMQFGDNSLGFTDMGEVRSLWQSRNIPEQMLRIVKNMYTYYEHIKDKFQCIYDATITHMIFSIDLPQWRIKQPVIFIMPADQLLFDSEVDILGNEIVTITIIDHQYRDPRDENPDDKRSADVGLSLWLEAQTLMGFDRNKWKNHRNAFTVYNSFGNANPKRKVRIIRRSFGSVGFTGGMDQGNQVHWVEPNDQYITDPSWSTQEGMHEAIQSFNTFINRLHPFKRELAPMIYNKKKR